jgi:hypothetical protein
MAGRRAPATSSEPFAAVPPGAHEWVTFADDEEERTWVFDVTFLLSGWHCIFGAGCQGVLTGPAPELAQGCCSYGAHFTDDADVARVEAAAGTLTDAQWQYRADAEADGVISRESGAAVTRIVDDACIFLNRPGFEGGPGCALHRAALDRDQLPLDLKPDVCWQLPLRREEEVDAAGHVTTTITQWDRRHWGDGGAEFHWWCTEASEAFGSGEPVWRTMAAELIALVGPTTYLGLAAYLGDRVRSATPLPHPTVRPPRP